MNLKQLELKRWTELLRAVRRARHITRAKRTPLARYLKLDKQALEGWNRAVAKLVLVNPSASDEYDRLESDAREHLSALAEETERWEELEKDVVRRIAKVKASKALTKPSAPIEERIKKRRKEKARAVKQEVVTAAVRGQALRDAQARAVKIASALHGVRISDLQQSAANRLLRNPLHEAALFRAQLRGFSGKELGDAADEFRRIEVLLKEAGFSSEDFQQDALTGLLVTFE